MVTATDSDDSVTDYTIKPGEDGSTFSIVAATGALTFTAAPNFEAPTDADRGNDYVVVVRATSGTGERKKTADQPITVTVTDVAGEAPGVPDAPTVVPATSVTSVTVTWTAPLERGAADHELRPAVPRRQQRGLHHLDGGRDRDKRDDHGARGEHGVRGAGAGHQRRGHGRLVRVGERHDGRERGAAVHPRRRRSTRRRTRPRWGWSRRRTATTA